MLTSRVAATAAAATTNLFHLEMNMEEMSQSEFSHSERSPIGTPSSYSIDAAVVAPFVEFGMLFNLIFNRMNV